MPREKRYVVTLGKDDKELIEKLAKRYKLSMSEITGYLYEQCDKHDMMRVGWEARMEKADQERERYAGLDDSCPALCFMENYFYCLWGRDGSTPTKTRLSRDLSESLEACVSCDKTLKIKLENESYQVKVRELEARLAAKSTKKFKIPQCNNGGRLSKDSTAFDNCPRSPSKPVSITNYCKKVNSGQGCIWLKMHLIGVGSGETTDTDKMK